MTTVKEIIDETIARVCVEYGVSREDLESPNREFYVVEARAEAAIRLRQLGLTFPKIGTLLNRDHTTIIHLVYKRRKRIKEQ